MKAIKFAASALAVLALAVSSGCLDLHAPRHENLEPVTTSEVNFEVTSYFLKLKDQKAKDVDWNRLKQDILAQVPDAGVMMRDFYKGEYNQSQEVHFTANVTPAVMRKALALQGELPKEIEKPSSLSALNSTLVDISTSETGGAGILACEPQILAAGVATSSRDMKFMPVIRSTGDLLMYYSISSGLEVTVLNCKGKSKNYVVPGDLLTERTSVAIIAKGQSMAVSGLRMKIVDPVTHTYAESPDNEVQIVVVTPTVKK